MKTRLILLIATFIFIYSVSAQVNEDELKEGSLIQKKGEEFLKPLTIYKNIMIKPVGGINLPKRV